MIDKFVLISHEAGWLLLLLRLLHQSDKWVSRLLMTPKNPHTRYGVCYLELLNARHVQGVNIKILLSTTVISGYVVRSRQCLHFRCGKFEHKPKYTGLSQLTFSIVLKCEYWHKFPAMLHLFPWKYDFIFILFDTNSMNVWKNYTLERGRHEISSVLLW